jgi:sugar O-acyltransferase (sialic acid O-acetyltransferase NeuD family)
MKTNTLIIGKGDDIITMILDNLASKAIVGEITILNNLNLPILSNFEHPLFQISISDSLELFKFEKWILGIYKPELKKKIVENLNLLDNHRFINVIHDDVDISLTSTLGFGCLVNSKTSIAAQTKIGNFVSINRNVSIGHHTIINDFVSINPGCNIAGHTSIGELTTIGMGSQILNNVKIGKNTIIGAGSIVTRDIPDNVVAWGSPCKIIRENV